MTLLFWVCVALLAIGAVGYPLTILLASTVYRPKRIVAPIEPSVTFLITAYNEESDIRRKLTETLALDYPHDKLEIIVASDGSTDRTDAIVEEFAPQGVKLLRVSGRKGKTEAQNQAVRIAKGDIVLFSDATTEYGRNAIRALMQNFADPKVGAVGGRFRYKNVSGKSFGAGTLLFWKFESLIKKRQSILGTITGCSGCIYAVRRSLYTPLPPEIISDFVEPLAVLRQGYRVIYEPSAEASEETTSHAREEFRMRVRVISRGMHGLLFMKGLLNPLRYPLVATQLILHKLLRWLAPSIVVVLIVATAFCLGRPAFNALFACEVAFLAFALIGYVLEGRSRLPKLIAIPLYIAATGAASIVAMWRVIRGMRAVTWETVRR